MTGNVLDRVRNDVKEKLNAELAEGRGGLEDDPADNLIRTAIRDDFEVHRN